MYKGKIPEDLNKDSVWALYLAEVFIRIAVFCLKKKSDKLFKLQ